MQIGREDVRIFKDRSVLNYCLFSFENVDNAFIAFVQEINLQVKCPTIHVLVEIIEIGIVIGTLKLDFPVEVFAQFFAEGSLTCSDIPLTAMYFGCTFKLGSLDMAQKKAI